MTVDCCQIWCKYVKENRWISVLSNITNTRFHSFPSKPTVSGISSPSKWSCWCSYHEIPDDVASYFPLRSFSLKPPYPAFEETGQDTLSLSFYFSFITAACHILTMLRNIIYPVLTHSLMRNLLFIWQVGLLYDAELQIWTGCVTSKIKTKTEEYKRTFYGWIGWNI